MRQHRVHVRYKKDELFSRMTNLIYFLVLQQGWMLQVRTVVSPSGSAVRVRRSERARLAVGTGKRDIGQR